MKDILSGPLPTPDEWESVDAEAADSIAKLPAEVQSRALACIRLSRKVAEVLWEQWKMTCKESSCFNSRATPRDAMSCAENIMKMMQCNLVHAVRIPDWGESFGTAIRTLVRIQEQSERKVVKRRPVKRRRK